MTVYRCTICGRGGLRGAVAVGTHYDREHASKPVSSWESAAIEAVKTLAAKREPFTFADVTAIAGDPANPKVEAGKLMALAHRRGLVERQGYTQSKRETTKSSAVAVWIGVAA